MTLSQNRKRRLVVVSAGLSQPSSTRLLADRLTQSARQQLASQSFDVEVTVIDVRDHAHEVVDNLLTGFAPSGLRDAMDAMANADGIIAVTPTFNASYSGLFKSFFDAVPEDTLKGKPVLVAATGGTARHSLLLEHALRPMFAYLRAIVVPTAVFAASEDWASAGTADDGLAQRISRAGAELADEVGRREPATVADPFALTTDFASLLGNA